LETLGFHVGSVEEASQCGIIIWKCKKNNGVSGAAHALERPEGMEKYPFFIKIGDDWTNQGLFELLEGYFLYFSGEKTFPWGETFPSGKKKRKLLEEWQRKAKNNMPNLDFCRINRYIRALRKLKAIKDEEVQHNNDELAF